MNQPLSLSAVAVALALAGSSLQAQQAYEQPETRASALAPAALLGGADFQVDPNVAWEGPMPRFTITSKYGTWQATGREMLGVRVSEIPAFGQLDKVSKSDAFASALGNAAVQPIKVAGDLVTNPVDTVGNLFAGIGNMVNRAGRTVGTAGQNAADGPAPAATGIGKAVPTDQGTAQPTGGISDPFGYNAARRDWARKVKIDPYTSNAALSAKLGDVAQASFLGGFTIDVTLGIVIAPVHYATAAYEQGALEAYQHPPVDVEMRNEARLKAMGVEGRPVRDFFRNRYFTPTLQTALVVALDSLGDVEGRGDVILFATNAVSEVQARYVIGSVLLLAQANRSTPLARVRPLGNVLGASTRDAKLVVAAPLDLVAWTPIAEGFARREDLAGPQRTLLVSGAVTARARQEFAALGWSVSDNLGAFR